MSASLSAKLEDDDDTHERDDKPKQMDRGIQVQQLVQRVDDMVLANLEGWDFIFRSFEGSVSPTKRVSCLSTIRLSTSGMYETADFSATAGGMRLGVRATGGTIGS